MLNSNTRRMRGKNIQVRALVCMPVTRVQLEMLSLTNLGHPRAISASPMLLTRHPERFISQSDGQLRAMTCGGDY